MKKGKLLNSELSYEIAKIGHTSHITLCDAGLPFPKGVKRIDLAIEAGYPSFIKTLDAILSEMMVEEIVLASEIKTINPKVYNEILETFQKNGMNPKIVEVSHTEFKEITRESEAIVRTGECTPYANIILKSGVVF
ncbi:MAG: D-ribose pyranase [Cetobacterium somerae]|jgi:D-ribose pyranase|uniref:D-ribose pyranase n=1 Tax=Cetobacterium TaxID=180162 RepID=UPI00163BAF1B|nr:MULTISPECIES: D-ribose pyranase [Cetobacterium]MBC2854605.1 D-ribose pyranase [Cetobacterium sp. 2G large]WVJ02375.1 D-ribose pyranase [Cetobacterium somerae]